MFRRRLECSRLLSLFQTFFEALVCLVTALIKLSIRRSVTRLLATIVEKLRILRFFSLSSVSWGRLRATRVRARVLRRTPPSAVSSFQKSAPENCATELAQRKLEIFPGGRSHNVSFSDRSFHRFPIVAITIRSIMTERDGPLSFDVAVVFVAVVIFRYIIALSCRESPSRAKRKTRKHNAYHNEVASLRCIK